MREANNGKNLELTYLPLDSLHISKNNVVKIHSDMFHEGSMAIPHIDVLKDFLAFPRDESSDIVMYFRLTIYLINFFSTEDPSKLHFKAAREVLREFEIEAEEKARDLLARELVKECKNFAFKIIPNELLQENIEGKLLFIISKKNDCVEHLTAEIEGKFWIDKLFIDFIAKIGQEGKRLAQKLSESSLKWYRDYLIDKKSAGLFRLWIDHDMQPYYCRYLKILTQILWIDKVKLQFEKKQKHLPALTQSVSRPFLRLLSPQTQIISSTNSTIIKYEEKIIAETPMIDPKIIPLVTKGAGNLNKIYHHRLLRFECRCGFEGWVQGRADPRVLKFIRGETEIVEKLGLTYKEAPSIIKSLLHAQAYMNFHFDDESIGNLIVLRQFESPKTHREEGIEIVLGTQLMPGYTFATDKRHRLLVPVPEMPPFVSSSNYYANQSLLQLLVMEEFTNKSMALAMDGSIEILDDRWKEFLKRSALPESVFKLVMKRWLTDGDDGGRFLVQLDKDRFTLGESYGKEIKFLIDQGKLRRKNQIQGKMSVKKSCNISKKRKK